MSETKTFADTLKELEAIVAELERGGVDLDKTRLCLNKALNY